MNERCRLIQGDALTRLREMPSESVHCCVTSPPYFSLRDYNTPGQMGLEKRMDCAGYFTGTRCGECYICKMTEVFAEVKRVLRRDGTCWLNIGSSYASEDEDAWTLRDDLTDEERAYVLEELAACNIL